MASEIGSEFWQEPNIIVNDRFSSSENDIFFTLSGRTSLDYIIREIKKKRSLTSVYLPSYCCKSMIEPFIRNNVSIQFYEVYCCENGFQVTYDVNNACEVILLLDYFGYENRDLVLLAEAAKKAGAIVIYDATHKLNRNAEVEALADYSFCSYRKWLYVNAASVRQNGCSVNINADQQLVRNVKYEELRNEAAKQKHDYIVGKRNDKQEYLRLFAAAEEILERDYTGYAAEPASVTRLKCIDISDITHKRRDNAQHLINGLLALSYSWLSLPYKRLNLTDCPLVVPVLIDSSLRDTVRRQLIENDIYCPVHWPFSRYHKNCGIGTENQRIYHEELSLICDQRYGIEDMNRILEIINIIGDTMQ